MPFPSMEDLRAAVQRACQPSYVPYIVEGRDRVLAMPRSWVLAHIEGVAKESLDLEDYWEYRRLLELFDLIGARDELQRLIAHGCQSADGDVREAAEDFSKPVDEQQL